MRRLLFVLALVHAVLIKVCADECAAAPLFDATANVPLCVAPGNQLYPAIVPDGAGGGIVVWTDGRGEFFDIYAHHVLASGVADPAWPVDGNIVCGAGGGQLLPSMVSDGAGGAIVVWYDYRNGVGDVFAQHLLASGAIDPVWPTDGLAICTASGEQILPRAVTDGAGGAIVAWLDYRSRNRPELFFQRVRATGEMDLAWPADGLGIPSASSPQPPAIVADDEGGVLVAWQDIREGGFGYDVRVQRVTGSGVIDPEWPSGGRVLGKISSQFSPQITSDGSGGCIVVWHYFVNGNFDIYSQRVLGSGFVDSVWPEGGRALCTALGTQNYPTVVSDGAGGAIAVWQDQRAGSNWDIYAQRILGSGEVDPAWPSDGTPLCIATGDQRLPVIVSDGKGGAIVGWTDYRAGAGADIYALRVRSSGTVDPSWPMDGQAVSRADGEQTQLVMVSGVRGGAIAAWVDQRTGAESDIYSKVSSRRSRHTRETTRSWSASPGMEAGHLCDSTALSRRARSFHFDGQPGMCFSMTRPPPGRPAGSPLGPAKSCSRSARMQKPRGIPSG